MRIVENNTGGLNVTLTPKENSGMLPYPLKYIVGEGVAKGSTVVKRITIEYVTDDGKHYLTTQL